MECTCCPRVVSQLGILVGKLGGHSGMCLLSQSGIRVGYPSWKAAWWSQWNVLVVPEWYPSWVTQLEGWVVTVECTCCPRVVSQLGILVGKLGGHSGMCLLSQSGIRVGYPSWKAAWWSQWNVLVVPEWYPSWVS